MQIIEFVDDLRLAEKGGARDQLSASLARLTSLLAGLGVRYRDNEGKLRRPYQSIPWVGFAADTGVMEVQIDQAKREKGASLCEAVIEL